MPQGKLFGYCPVAVIFRALNFFFHEKWEYAIKHNLNILFTIPWIFLLLVIDVFRLYTVIKKI